VPVQRNGFTVSVSGPARLTPTTMTVPGDASSAAFLVVAALILPDSEVRIDGVLLNPTRTAFLDVLRRMNATIETGITASAPEPVGWIVARSSQLAGIEVPADLVPALIDEVPALAVAAACAAAGLLSAAPPSCGSRRATASARWPKAWDAWASPWKNGPTASPSMAVGQCAAPR